MEESGVKSRHDSPRIAIVGAGNVATHLAMALRNGGADIISVSSANPAHASALAARVDSVAVPVRDINPDADFVLIAVADRAVAPVSAQLPEIKGIVAHTSGSVPLEALSARHKQAAVVYPLQTFSREVPLDVSQVPFFTEASDAATLATADALVGLMSAHIYHADSQSRRALHLAGVLTSNFPIHLMQIAERALQSKGFPLEVVKPLMEVTLAKAFAVGPEKALTGPARRGDRRVVELQESMLRNPDDARIYHDITTAILNEYSNEHD